MQKSFLRDRKRTGSGRHRLAALVALAPFGALPVDAAQDHGQLGGRDAEFRSVRAGEGEGALFQATQVQGETVALPGQDFEPIAAAILEDKQIARQRIAAELRRDHRRQAVETLAAIHGLDAHPDAAAQAEGQHDAALKAATSMATVWASVPAGTRTTTPVGSTISTIASGTTRTGTNVACVAVEVAPCRSRCCRVRRHQ